MKLGRKIKKILSVQSDTFSLKLKFEDGHVAWVSLEYLFARPKGLVAEVLKGQLFNKCFVESGALAWPNGLELCPDALRLLAEKQSRVA